MSIFNIDLGYFEYLIVELLTPADTITDKIDINIIDFYARGNKNSFVIYNNKDNNKTNIKNNKRDTIILIKEIIDLNN